MPGTCLIPAALEEAPHPKLQNWSIDVNCNWCYHRLSSPNNHKIDGHWASGPLSLLPKISWIIKVYILFSKAKKFMEILHNELRQCQKPEASNARSSGLHCIRLTKNPTSLEKRIRKQFSVPPRVAEKTRFFSVEKVGSLVVWWFGEVRLPHEISQKTKVSCRIATLDPFFK